MKHKDYSKQLKKELIKVLKHESIKTISDLWNKTRYYFSEKNIPIGGNCSTIGNYISIKGVYMGTRLNFTVNLNELK